MSDMLTLFAVCTPHSVMCKMCELESCLSRQSDEEIIRGVTLKSLISLISCHANNTSLYMYLRPAAKYKFMSWSWIHKGIDNLDIFPVNFVNVIVPLDCSFFSRSSSGQEMTSSRGPYGPHIGASGGMAISTTFSEDGMEPETFHLCFAALSLKTSVSVCMYFLDSVSMCMHVYQHAWREGESYHGTCFPPGDCLTETRCVCMCVCKGGRAECNNAILAYLISFRTKLLSCTMWVNEQPNTQWQLNGNLL